MIGTLTNLLAQLDPDSNTRRGHQFEAICNWFLENDPRFGHLVQVWLWDDWPGNWVPLNVAATLVAAKVTTQPVETVVAVLGAHRAGASINAAAKAAGVNFRTAQRIINGTSEMPERYAVAC